MGQNIERDKNSFVLNNIKIILHHFYFFKAASRVLMNLFSKTVFYSEQCMTLQISTKIQFTKNINCH